VLGRTAAARIWKEVVRTVVSVEGDVLGLMIQ